MVGWVRGNQGKKKTTYYVVIPWDRMDGSGKKKKWQFKYDKRGDRFDSKAHANRFLEYLRTLIDDGTFSPLDWMDAKPHSFESLHQQYLTHYKQKLSRGEISPSTLAYKRRYRNNYLEPFFKGLDVRQLVNLTFSQFYNELPRGLKAKTRHNIMTEVQKFFRWCKEQGVIKGEAPRYTEMANLKRLAQEQRPPVTEMTHVMSDSDFELAVGQMAEDDRPIFRFIRITGCRPSEARALQRFDFDWRGRKVAIRRTWVDTSPGEVLIERAKSVSNRLLGITKEMEFIVKSVSQTPEIPFVFCNPKTETAYTRRELDYRWRTALQRARLPHMELKNATRASAACTWLKLGYSYEEVGAVLGQEHVSTTKFYGRIFADQTVPLLERRTKTAGTKTEPKTQKVK